MPRWNASTWVLVGLATIILLVGGDQVIRAISPLPEPKTPPGTPPAKSDPALILKVGQPAPGFKLPSEKKEPVELAQFKGQEVVLTFFCGCGACRDMAKLMAESYKASKRPAPTTVSIFTSHWDPAGTPGFINTTGANFIYLYSAGTPGIVDTYQGTPCPKVYVIDKDQKIRYISQKATEFSNPATMMQLARVLGLSYKPPKGYIGPLRPGPELAPEPAGGAAQAPAPPAHAHATGG